MIRYLAILWDEQAAATVDDCLHRARRYNPNLRIVLHRSGVIVLTSNGAADPKPQLLCRDEGVLLGTLFASPGWNTQDTHCRRAVLSTSEAKDILASAGQALIDRYWGNYVAFLRRPIEGIVRVIRSPFAQLCCLHSAVDGMRMYASDMETLAQLRIRLHSISWLAVARTFLGPDAPGACHLNEVREVAGGACEDASGSGCQRHVLWDPAAIASQAFQAGDAQAPGALRSATRACVQAWTSEHSHVLVGLSGGLDSSVTLSCAAEAPSAPIVTAVTQFEKIARVMSANTRASWRGGHAANSSKSGEPRYRFAPVRVLRGVRMHPGPASTVRGSDRARHRTPTRRERHFPWPWRR